MIFNGFERLPAQQPQRYHHRQNCSKVHLFYAPPGRERVRPFVDFSGDSRLLLKKSARVVWSQKTDWGAWFGERIEHGRHRG
jgi:hypothetical protein